MDQLTETGLLGQIKKYSYFLQLSLAASLAAFGCKRVLLGVIFMQIAFVFFYQRNYLHEIGCRRYLQPRYQYEIITWKIALVLLFFLSVLILFNLIFTSIIMLSCRSAVNEDPYWDSLTNMFDTQFKAPFSVIVQLLSFFMQGGLTYLFYYKNSKKATMKSTDWLSAFQLKDLKVLNEHNNECAICLDQLSFLPSNEVITSPPALPQQENQANETNQDNEIKKSELCCRSNSSLQINNQSQVIIPKEIDEINNPSVNHQLDQNCSLASSKQLPPVSAMSAYLKEKCDQMFQTLISTVGKGVEIQNYQKSDLIQQNLKRNQASSVTVVQFQDQQEKQFSTPVKDLESSLPENRRLPDKQQDAQRESSNKQDNFEFKTIAATNPEINQILKEELPSKSVHTQPISAEKSQNGKTGIVSVLPQSKIIKLGCNHLFHLECIQTWLESSINMKCPTCRQAIQTK